MCYYLFVVEFLTPRLLEFFWTLAMVCLLFFSNNRPAMYVCISDENSKADQRSRSWSQDHTIVLLELMKQNQKPNGVDSLHLVDRLAMSSKTRGIILRWREVKG